LLVSNTIVDPTLQRVAHAVGEQRLDLGLSLRKLERCSGVSRATIKRIERGVSVDPVLLLRVAGVLTTLELHRPPLLERELQVLVQPERRLLQPGPARAS
jgi:transcriptional regulator with XRE-family HTH domain